MASDPPDDREHPGREPGPVQPDLPASLVPRWLALLVLIALLLAAGYSVYAVLTAEPLQQPHVRQEETGP